MEGPTILVVDDDAATREVLRLVLEEEGYRVEDAPGGAEALALARARRPALVLLDLRMPAMDGPAFARAYRREAPAPAPIVCVTAASHAAEACRDVAPAAVLAKPFELDRLLETVAALAPRRAA